MRLTAAVWLLLTTSSALYGDAASTCVAFAPQLQRRRSAALCDTKVRPMRSLGVPTRQRGRPPMGMTLRLYNSLTRRKDLFAAVSPPNVTMYTCGPTVYDFAHIGNFRAFLTYDVLKRTLLYFRYRVTHVCNITDVDDKIIARCNRENVSVRALTEKYEALFLNDLRDLNVLLADAYPRATDHIDDMVTMVLDLQQRGLAYEGRDANDDKTGSWYFNVEAMPAYGTQLVNLHNNNNNNNNERAATPLLKTSSRMPSVLTTDADEYNAEKAGRVQDFALWKAFKPDVDRDDATWDTVLGRGRPGWHLECSAMAKKYFGTTTLDLHCGGIDLKFPHHENEIAQSEGSTGIKFCNCWIHNGFVNIGTDKMSKSTGNFITLQTACPTELDIRAYRYLVVTSHYRNPLSFSEAAMTAAKSALKRLDSVLARIDEALIVSPVEGKENVGRDDEEDAILLLPVVKEEMNSFELAIADDLSMPRATASLFGLVRAAEMELRRATTKDVVGLRAVRNAMMRMDAIFGIFYEVPSKSSLVEEEDAVPENVVELVRRRSIAKNAKNWALADSIRDQIQELGFSIRDGVTGESTVCPSK